MLQKNMYTILLEEPLRIALSGPSGCGNTTVSTLLASKLGIPCINYTFRALAKELGMPLSEIIEKAKTDFRFDRMVDEHQIEMAQKSSCVLGSRLAIWMLKEAQLKVGLIASPEVRIQRIYEREGGSLSDIADFTKMRDADDTRRYEKLYNIDNTDYSCADVLIDTEQYNPEQITELIIAELIKRNFIVKKSEHS